MADRYRTRSNRRTKSGTCVKRSISTGAILATYPSSGLSGTYSDCWDTVGDWDKDNPFLLKKVSQYYPTLSGSYPSSPYPKWEFTGEYPITGQYGAVDPESKFPVPNAATLQEQASRGAASSHPGRAHIGLPTALGEARELPRMFGEIPEAIHRNGRRFLGEVMGKGKRGGPFGGLANPLDWLRQGANANLAYRFGWKPFIADLLAMLGLQAAIAKRLKMLGHLATTGSIHRRYSLPAESDLYDEGVKCTQSIGAFLYHRKVTAFTSQPWLSYQWKLNDGVTLPTNPDDLALLAGRLALGLNGPGGLAAAWELTPWSWLHDWFFGLGTWLGANNNSLPITLVSCCWMRTTCSFTEMQPQPQNPGWVALVGDYWMGMQVKRRIPLGTILPLLPSLPHIPALTGGQLGILGSLATQLGLRR